MLHLLKIAQFDQICLIIVEWFRWFGGEKQEVTKRKEEKQSHKAYLRQANIRMAHNPLATIFFLTGSLGKTDMD